MATSAAADGVAATSTAATNATMVSEMQALSDSNNAMTMASMKISAEQQATSALASIGNTGAKNISDAAKGQ